MKKKSFLALIMALAMIFSMLSISGNEASAKTKIKLSVKTITLFSGETKVIKLNGLTKKESKRVKWSSSNKSIITVNNKGKVKATQAGKAYIYAKYKGKKYKCKVIVKYLYGSVSGNITYKYNSYIGHVGDKEARVYLISTTGSGKKMPTLSSYIYWGGLQNINKYNKYGIFITQVSSTGEFKFYNVPVGKYKLIVVSKYTTTAQAFDDEKGYRAVASKSVNNLVNNTNAKFFGEYIGYRKYVVKTITVYEDDETTFDYDFGITHV